MAKRRTVVFVDAANILYSQKDLGWRIDYGKLKGYFEKIAGCDGFYFYTGKVGDFKSQVGFLDKLIKLGYVVTAKEVKIIKSGNRTVVKGNLDVELALDAFRVRRKYDVLVLMSGDSDFAYLVDLLKKEKKRVVVVSTRGHVSKELLDRADEYWPLSTLRKEIEYKNQEIPLRGSLKCDKGIIAKKIKIDKRK